MNYQLMRSTTVLKSGFWQIILLRWKRLHLISGLRGIRQVINHSGHPEFTYFDAVVTERVDYYQTIVEFLSSIDGKLFAECYELRNPRVQAGIDIAVLTYQLFARTNLLDMEYNVIEVFQKENNEWKVIHST